MDTKFQRESDSAPAVPSTLPEGWCYSYSDPMGPDCPREHLCILLLRLGNPRISCGEICERLGICSQDGKPSKNQKIRVGRVLRHLPNDQWLRQTYVDTQRSQSMALLKINKAHEVVADTVLGLMSSADDRLRLKAAETFLRHFGCLSPLPRESDTYPPAASLVDASDVALMLDVTSSVVEEGSSNESCVSSS